MSNLFWYCSLAVIGLVCIFFAMYKNENYVTFILFYIFTTSITWFGEFVALGIFSGYAYKPGVFTDPWAENILGHLILNSTLWPGTAMLVARYSLGYGWILLITAVFILAEYLFVILGVYEQHWWRYYMSAIIVVSFQVISKKWFIRMNQFRHGFTRHITFFFVAFLIMYSPNPLLLIAKMQFYRMGWVGNKYLDSSILTFIYYPLLCSITVFFVCMLDKWYWKVVPLIIFIISDINLVNTNMLIFQHGWNLFYLAITHALCLAAFITLEKHVLKPRLTTYE
ncbi:MAG: hypothetical protein ACM3TR_07570 [Caulobacteraceae bacterium]